VALKIHATFILMQRTKEGLDNGKVRILSIHAHPDDMEILAGGTLLHLVERKHEVVVVSMTAGDCGTNEYGPDEISAIRTKEAAAAVKMLGGGAEYICAGFKDLAIFNDDASRRKITELLRQTQPDIVLTASPVDYHCDHEATSSLVRDACFAAPAPNYKSGTAAPMKAIPHLYFMDPDEGRDRDGNAIIPHFVVDVTRHIEQKTALLACHESQRAWLQKHHNMDNYLETMQEWSKGRGALGGYNFGEGFRQYSGHPYPSTPLLQNLLDGVSSQLKR
jgi:LmbE family N-acetylglucosaminyl deacetylase